MSEIIIETSEDIYNLISKYSKEVYNRDVPPIDVSKHSTIIILEWFEAAKKHYGIE